MSSFLPEVGARVRMTGLMPEDPSPLPIGEEGTVIRAVKPSSVPHQIYVKWDSGRSLILLSTDPYTVVSGV